MKTGLTGTLLQMEHITKSFSGVKVLEDVSFDLDPGEVHVIAGENGAGKTTLIKILAGVHTDFEGEIRLNGQSIRFKNPHDAAESGISAIHQDMSLINAMTVVDNIFLGREHAHANVWMDYRTQKEKAQKLLMQLGIDANFNLPVEEYPVSVRQMIEIAKALAYDARIIIMDEPTSALNELEVKRLFQIIQDLKHKRYGIIYISHRLEEIYEISDRISVLRDGKHIGTAKADDLSPQELIRWMVGREINQQFPGIDILITIREEIYQNIPELYDDAQKIRDIIEHVRWTPEELKIMITQRIRHALETLLDKNIKLSNPDGLWEYIFEKSFEENDLSTFKYIVDRTLYRPRELIFLSTSV